MARPGLQKRDVGHGYFDPSSKVLLGQIEFSAPFADDLTKTSSCNRCHFYLQGVSLSKHLNRPWVFMQHFLLLSLFGYLSAYQDGRYQRHGRPK